MINETIINYDQVTAVTQHPLIVLTIIVIWIFPLIAYVLIGFLRKARTSNGRVLQGTRMVQTLNFWIGFFIYFFLQGGLILGLLIFPLWMKLI